MSVPALDSALKQVSTTQCVSDKFDDRGASQFEDFSSLLSLERPVDLSDRQMQTLGEHAVVEDPES